MIQSRARIIGAAIVAGLMTGGVVRLGAQTRVATSTPVTRPSESQPAAEPWMSKPTAEWPQINLEHSFKLARRQKSKRVPVRSS